ncbi:hypothetical protein BDW59DRAFT_182128 [Aspergillus cavernicola]|uniref:N-acetyltransferase domain-containing protein n=1 Tax=Aspergillus cavernicola TaxID=176166 RepID=A0ABR4IUM6_9EURO
MPDIHTTNGLWDHLEPASNLLAAVFDNDPILRYMLCNLSYKDYLVYLRPYWRGLCRAALLNGGVITEVNGWQTAGIMLPPGRSVDNPWTIIPAAFGFLGVLWRIGFAGFVRMLWDFTCPVNAAKERVLQGQEHYYLFAIGTEYEHQGKGLARALMESYQYTAWSLEKPIWLEATTEYSRDLYLSLEFEVVEEITIGEGKADMDGRQNPDGLGVTLWAMVWWPKASQRLNRE